MADARVDANYFIDPRYRTNPARGAVDTGDYWNARRIERSSYFQYSVYRAARRELDRIADARVLDLGCGTAIKAAELLIPGCAFYCGLDQSSAITYCRQHIVARNAEFQVDDLEAPRTTFTAPFDVIICADVVEHLAEPDRLLTFAARQLSRRGRLIVSTPERDVAHGRGRLDSPNPEHVREWNRDEFHALLTACGLTVLSQRLAPQFRLSFGAAGRALLRSQVGRARAYWGCQIAICAGG
jgi:SAM-dependent methyltransferase